MILKEYIAATYHLSIFLRRHNYLNRFQLIVASLNPQTNNATSRQQADKILLELIKMSVEYEETTGFPLDNHPYCRLLGIEQYVGSGALSRALDLITDNGEEALSFFASASARLKAAQSTNNQLNLSHTRLPIYAESIEFYKINEKRSFVRVDLANKDASDLENSVKGLDGLNKALRPLSQLSGGGAAYQLKVKALSHSSPESVLIEVLAPTALALNMVVKAIIKRWKEVEDVRKIRTQTESLKIDNENKKHKEAILKHLKELEESGKASNKALAASIVKKHGKNLDGAASEVEKGLEGSITYLENLIVTGGSVQVYLSPHQSAQNATEQEGTVKFIEDRKELVELKPDKKMLEDKTGGEDERN